MQIIEIMYSPGYYRQGFTSISVCDAFWYYLCNSKNVKNTLVRVFLLVKLQESKTPLWVFFMYFKLYK